MVGEACSDIEALRAQPALFGPVASAPTLYRTVRNLSPEVVEGLWSALGQIRSQVWDRALIASGSDPVVLDIDATLIEIHSENKAGTAPTHKRGFGFHPMLCFADATGEALAGTLRPGNAGANTIADHLAVLDAAIDQLPGVVCAGHRRGDDPALVTRLVQVRADSAGCSTRFAAGCRARNIGFAVVARRNDTIHGAIHKIRFDDNRWQPAITQSGEPRRGAAVADITDLVDLTDWPAGTRLIVRREPRHPGAQRSLFPSERFRYWGHYTDATGDPATLDAHMRAHAHVEDHIQRLKDSGLDRMPFADFDANAAWLALVCWADSLVRWFQRLCCTGPLATANPKRLRWQLWHTPARLVRSGRRQIVRLLDDWPTTDQLLGAYQHIATIT